MVRQLLAQWHPDKSPGHLSTSMSMVFGLLHPLHITKEPAYWTNSNTNLPVHSRRGLLADFGAC